MSFWNRLKTTIQRRFFLRFFVNNRFVGKYEDRNSSHSKHNYFFGYAFFSAAGAIATFATVIIFITNT